MSLKKPLALPAPPIKQIDKQTLMKLYFAKEFMKLKQPPDIEKVIRDPILKQQMIDLLCRTKYEKSGGNVASVMLRDDKYRYSEAFKEMASEIIWQIEGRMKGKILHGQIDVSK